ncbi:uncharacterized protein H6S33_008830 [Morchella sextelata]|nr:uncharacterized protein H6S33_008830 [Morchella sextelata]KAH0602355.1 hypothetical protein H6S33_008830 [Morchella sextelata]
MDDGDNHKSGFILNTSGFTLNDVKAHLFGLPLGSRPPSKITPLIEDERG